MELATSSDVCQPSSLILPAISHVFTINYVAEKLGENEEWLWELSIDMFPEDGCLRVYGVGARPLLSTASSAYSKSSQTKGPPEERRQRSNQRNSAAAVFTAC